jgi:prevent-host-death family protein
MVIKEFDMNQRSLAAAQFKATCLAVLDEVNATGQPVVITKRGVPVGRLVPILDGGKLFFGCDKDQMKILGDIVAPLDDVTWGTP